MDSNTTKNSTKNKSEKDANEEKVKPTTHSSKLTEKERIEITEKLQNAELDRILDIGIANKLYIPSLQTPFKVFSTEPTVMDYQKPKDELWTKASTERLVAGGSFKTAQVLITGSIGGLLWISIYPRIFPQAEVFGITSVVATFMALLGSLFDFGTWTGFQWSISKTIGLGEKESAINYSRTIMAYKLFTGILFNITVYMVVQFIFPLLPGLRDQSINAAWSICFIYAGYRWFFDFGVMFEHIIQGSQRFDYEYYISIFELIDSLILKIFFWWYCNTFLFPGPGNEVLANASAIVISDTIELGLKYLMRAWVVKKLKLLPLKKILVPKFDATLFREMASYGKWVMGRQILAYFSEAGSFLWMMLLAWRLPQQTAEIIGYWNLAASTVSIFLIASTMTRPIFPAISEAYVKKDSSLIQSYWIAAGKWFFVWAFFALGIYIGFGEQILSLISGDAWALSGQIIRVIAPATFLKFGNEYLIGILNAIGKPKKVMDGTIIKIPFMIVGAYIMFPSGAYGSIASVYFGIELIFFIYLYKNIRGTIKIATPRWIMIIPGVACFMAVFFATGINFLIWPQAGWLWPNAGVASVILMIVIYVILYFILFLWMGGIEDSDFEEYKEALKAVFPSEQMAEDTISNVRWFARLSPLYGKFNSKKYLQVEKELEEKNSN